ncbi:MAG: pyridoxamine 5'-phosphate oxidase family protein [Firmicutes bacterium]|nr:pyridoxamine 5'-phosphate oxidase family protein [Bacillota bacterium]
MRRKDRQVVEINEIIKIIDNCDVCRLAFFDCEYPYIVPLNFGFTAAADSLALYFHGAGSGKKMSLIEKNPHVAFEMDSAHKLIKSEKPCSYTMEYESVMGYGKITQVNGEEKIKGLKVIMDKYDKKENYNFTEEAIADVAVLKLSVVKITGKRLKLNC